MTLRWRGGEWVEEEDVGRGALLADAAKLATTPGCSPPRPARKEREPETGVPPPSADVAQGSDETPPDPDLDANEAPDTASFLAEEASVVERERRMTEEIHAEFEGRPSAMRSSDQDRE